MESSTSQSNPAAPMHTSPDPPAHSPNFQDSSIQTDNIRSACKFAHTSWVHLQSRKLLVWTISCISGSTYKFAQTISDRPDRQYPTFQAICNFIHSSAQCRGTQASTPDPPAHSKGASWLQYSAATRRLRPAARPIFVPGGQKNLEPLRFGILRSSRAATTRSSPVPGKFARFFDRQYPIVRFAQAYISRPTYDFKTLEPFV